MCRWSVAVVEIVHIHIAKVGARISSNVGSEVFMKFCVIH